jgi:hypothetical protein
MIDDMVDGAGLLSVVLCRPMAIEEVWVVNEWAEKALRAVAVAVCGGCGGCTVRCRFVDDVFQTSHQSKSSGTVKKDERG